MWLFSVGFSHHILFSVSVDSLAMNFCSQMVGLGSQARGRLSAPLPTRQRAKCEVTVEWLGEGRRVREAGVLLCDPEWQWSEHLAASWRRRGWTWRAHLLLRLDWKEGPQQRPWSSPWPVTPERNNQPSEATPTCPDSCFQKVDLYQVPDLLSLNHCSCPGRKWYSSGRGLHLESFRKWWSQHLDLGLAASRAHLSPLLPSWHFRATAACVGSGEWAGMQE